MFQKNLEAIRIKNPQLAERLEKIDINSIAGIDVMEAESKDLVIAYHNTPLNSTIDPIREAKTTWNRTVTNELKKNDVQVVFGLGLGYLFKRAYISAESKLILIEPFLEILRFVLEHVDFSGEFSDERVYITDNVGDVYNRLQKEFLSGDRVEFLFLNSYALMNQEILVNLTTRVSEIIEGRKNDENTIFNLSRSWTENFIKNIVSFSGMRPLGFLEGKFADKTALIISAGPSLADDIEKIKTNQGKFVTIAVGKAFNTLVKADIIPDFTVFADAKYSQNQFQGMEKALEKTNLILLSKCDNYIYNLNSKSKILYFSEADSMNDIFRESGLINSCFYKSGSSVSIISYYVAKAMGFGKIIFSGLDLAFINAQTHASFNSMNFDYFRFLKYFLQKSEELIKVKDKDGSDLLTREDSDWAEKQLNTLCKDVTYEDSYIEIMESKAIEIGSIELCRKLQSGIKYLKIIFLNQDLLYIKDKEGNDLLTRSDYAWFIRQFGEIFTEELNLAQIINTSLKGAFIKGMKYMEFSEVLETMSETKPDIDKIIAGTFAETEENWNKTLEKVYSKLILSCKELELINQESVKLYEELDKVCSNLRSAGKVEYSSEAFTDLNSKTIDTRQKIINNIFISNSMQETIWYYTKNYITKAVPSREDLICNLELDRNFFKNTQEESSGIIKDLKQTLETLEGKCLAV